jgi:hypothetical protein
MHPRQAEVPRHPGRHLGAAPQPAVLGRRPQPLGQGGQHGLGQQARRPAIPPPLVAQRRGAEGVVAGRQFLHPARREGQHLADLEEGPPLRQQPDRLMVPRLGHIAGRPVARLQLPNGKMINDPCHGCAPRPWSSRLPPHARAGDRRSHSEPITRKRYDIPSIRFTDAATALAAFRRTVRAWGGDPPVPRSLPLRADARRQSA